MVSRKAAWCALGLASAAMVGCTGQVISVGAGSASTGAYGGTGATTGSGALSSGSSAPAGGAGGAGPGGAGVGGSSVGGGNASCIGEQVAVPPVGATYVAVDADQVYWSDYAGDGAVWSAPKTGGPATKLSSSPTTNGSAGLAVDDTRVYWANGDGGVFSAPKAGGSASVLLPPTADGASSSLAIDDQYVYAFAMTASFDTQLVTVPKAGGSMVVLADALQSPDSLAVDTNNVYWIEGAGGVNSMPKSGGSVAALSDAGVEGGAMVLVADDSGLYGLDAACNVLRFSTSGGKNEVLASASSNVAMCGIQLAVDAANLYWSTLDWGTPGTLTLHRVSKAGGSQASLAACERAPEAAYVGVAVDSADVYWPAGNPTAMLKLPK